jgi:HTH-type transcriptional regulator/antitoxin HigA
MTQVANQYIPDFVSPPRETLRELLEERSMSRVELAKRMGKSAKAVGEILSDTDDVAITPETALQLERTVGLTARFWLNRESAYRESLAREKERAIHESAVDWLRTLPLRGLRALGYVTAPRNDAVAVRETLEFFRVVSVESWRLIWAREEVAYRMSATFDSEIGHLAAWLRHGEILAEKIPCEDYDSKAFEAILPEIRSLTTAPVEKMCAGLVELSRGAGVAVVFVPEFPKTHVCGAARWIAGGRQPIIYLSLRHKTDDHLWFTFFHEACHILKHGKKPIYVDDENPSGAQIETEANRFARNFLIPPDAYSEFTESTSRFFEADIRQFAARYDITPGIVVGRLQHEGLLEQKFQNRLKRRFEFLGLNVAEVSTTKVPHRPKR